MYDDEPCGCGRTSLRLSPIIGRKKQMIKFKGTTLYPPALFDLLNEMEEVLDFVVDVYSNEIGMDEVRGAEDMLLVGWDGATLAGKGARLKTEKDGSVTEVSFDGKVVATLAILQFKLY